MARMQNQGGNYDYYKYKQGVWYMKSDDVNDPDYGTRIFKDISGNEVKVSGVFVGGLSGIVTDLSTWTSEDGTYETLNITLDNKEKLSISLPSGPSREVIQTFENLDFTKDVNLIAWEKDDWYKLSVKQEGEHVKNSFFEWNGNKVLPVEGSEYPVRPAKDSATYKKDKAMFDIDEVDFLKKHVEKISALIPKAQPAKEDMLDVNTDEAEDINPEDVPF